jgi:hypothetical protein
MNRCPRKVLAWTVGASAMLAVTSAAGAQDVAVEVVDVAGAYAYVAPGASAGIHRNDTVTLGGRRHVVVASTARSALIQRNSRALKVGVRGTSTTSRDAQEELNPVEPPRELAMFRGQWPQPELPSASQHPTPVPLGGPTHDSSVRAALSLRSTAIVPTSGSAGAISETELRARVHYEPLREYPFALDADLAAQVWLARGLDQRSGRRSRPLPRVRQLQAAYGDDQGLYAALGRLRHASRTLGMLDGVRAQTPLGHGFSLGAFGGFVPHPLDERPDLDASRFGADVGYRDLEGSLRPEVSLSAQGSRFAGTLDERRLTGFVDVYPGDSHVGGYAELSMFDRDNPWNAAPTQLSAAGIDGSVRVDAVELDARLDMQRPERSLWLASFLPPEWLCTHAPQAPPAAETCRDDDMHLLAAANAGYRTLDYTLRAGVSHSSTASVDADQLGTFVQAAVLDVIARARLEAGVMASTGTLLHSAGVNLGVGMPVARDMLDIALRYRPSLNRYEADTGAYLEHVVSANFAFVPSSTLSIDLDADFITGRDLDAFLVQTLLTLRPELD